MISAIIIVGGKVDKDLYKKCLDSLSWVDEIVKVETDNLKGGFSDFRNEGARRAKGDWLLYVDTDEEVTEKLREEIKLAISHKSLATGAYAIPRANILLGKRMRWGGWYPDYVLRLIKKDKLKGWFGDLHEQPKIDGEIGHLKEPMIHRTHRNLAEMVEKTNKWSEIEARLLFESHHPKMVWWRFFSVAFREFWYRAVLKLGFLDGPVGVIEIIYQMFSRMITYAKLWEIQINYESGNL